MRYTLTWHDLASGSSSSRDSTDRQAAVKIDNVEGHLQFILSLTVQDQPGCSACMHSKTSESGTLAKGHSAHRVNWRKMS